MLVSLISPLQSITSLGIRSLSAYLRQAGCQTQVIFLPMPNKTGWYEKYESDTYGDAVIREVKRICAGSDLIGLTLMTQTFLPAAHLTQALKELGIPVAWGGIHPTARPEEALEYADMVCLGEGEGALLELVQKMASGQPYEQVQNFWFKKNGQIIKNPVRPLIADLNVLPYFDYDLAGHFILEDQNVTPMTEPLLKQYMAMDMGLVKGKPTYRTMVTRGCPHNCTYCCNNVLLKHYDRRELLRKRTPDHVLGELVQVKSRLPFIGSVCFVDDTLFILSQEDLRHFAEMYRSRVALPFLAYGSPGTISEAKLKILVDAGLLRINMGIESGSTRTLKSYQRHSTKEQVVRAANIINGFRDRIQPPRYNVITDNPWETLDDRIDTLELLQRLPRPFHVLSFSLTFYPGTQLFEKARNEHLVSNENEQILQKNYWFTRGTYYNLLLYCYSLGIPRWVMNIATRRRVVAFLSKGWLDPLYKLVAWVRDKLRRHLLARAIRAQQEP